jgi:integrase
VTYRGFRSLRHSADTRLARQTGNLQLVAAHLDHADVSTAAAYAKWSDDTLREAVRNW